MDLGLDFDIQGHRGCRGLMPENTVPAFIHACELGVRTLEMDVVISADGQVIVSHEPWFSEEISTSPFDQPITKDNEKDFNIYKMTLPTLRRFDIGLKPHPRFKDQKKMAAIKPTLKNVVDSVKLAGFDPFYNIEIKRVIEHDNVYHPAVLSYCNRVLKEIIALGIKEKTTIQSFDHETLNLIYDLDKSIKTAMLVEDNNPLEWHLAKLNHQPFFYSPNYTLVNEALITNCRKKLIKVIPWTINEVEDMNKMISLKVDGIITDYPDRLINL
jgi:glycerophosphoryl diester phosphodiesterase